MLLTASTIVTQSAVGNLLIMKQNTHNIIGVYSMIMEEGRGGGGERERERERIRESDRQTDYSPLQR